MDLKAVQAKLDAQANRGRRKVDYTKHRFRPSIGRQEIRIVPYKFRPDFPFIEMYFYYNIGRKFMASPKNWGEVDPIEEFVKKLRESNDSENFELIKKLYARRRVLVPVLVRGEEEKGVRFWEFGTQIYNELLQLAADPEIGDFTDVMEGRDIKLNTVGPEVTGTSYNRTMVSPSLRQTPLADTKEEIERLLDDQIDVLTLYHKLSADEVKESLQKWLTPEGDEDESEQASSNYKEDNNDPFPADRKKVDVEDEFQRLFDEK